jgi:amino acid adenylation domain-containing protein
VPVVVTSSVLADSASALRGLRTVRLDRDLPAQLSDRDPERAGSAERAAYVIYTSGSTGTPKGVIVEHRQVLRLFDVSQALFGFGSSDVWTMFHSFGFDFSVWEIWGALLHGGRLVVVPTKTSRSPDAFYALLERERVTVLNQTPSAFQGLVRLDRASTPARELALRHVIFGGEALDPQILRDWFARRGDQRPALTNMYGITETTVHVTHHRLTRGDAELAGKSVIGRPLDDLAVYLLDADGKQVPTGEPGEVYVGGAGVARGYLKRPELDAQRFLRDPFSGQRDARMYRSGDLASRLSDGTLVYLGRGDDQVKIRGFRIELGEVESCLRSSSNTAAAVVLARDYGEGDKRLIAYVVPAPESSRNQTIKELRALVAERLPEHMRPSAYVALEALPLTTNGKVDRAALPLPEHSAERASAEPEERAADPLQGKLHDIWKATLGVPALGLHDDFFEAGGTSLSAIKVLLSIHEQTGVALDMSVWAEHATVAAFAKLIAGDLQIGSAE